MHLEDPDMEPANAPPWVLKMIADYAEKKDAEERASEARKQARQDAQEPPVVLKGNALKVWEGNRVVDKADGKVRAKSKSSEVDTSETLFQIGLALAQAGGTEQTIIEALSNRDLTLGYEKYSNRADGGQKEYESIAKQVVTAAEKASQTTRLVKLADGVALWHTPELEPFATLPIGEHKENRLTSSRTFRPWLAGSYYEQTGTVPSGNALKDAIETLEGKALFSGAEHAVHTRLAEHEGAIYLDLTNKSWEAVKISDTGWEVVNDPPVKFRRTQGMQPLPTPKDGGSIETLRGFLNLKDADLPLVLCWLVAAHRPTGPYPVLVLNGGHGSAKSTTAKVLRRLIDPNQADLRSAPQGQDGGRDLKIEATNGWVIDLDNLSSSPQLLSDALCRLSTGGGFSTRRLYSNDELTIFDAQRPVILNGIDELVTRGDLMDRSIIVSLPTISEAKRKTEGDFWSEFERAGPGILDALLDAVSRALAHVGEVVLQEQPRMADFARWATAAEPALGLADGAFMKAYRANRGDANALVLEASPIAEPLFELVGAKGLIATAEQILGELCVVVEPWDRAPDWPKTARALGGMLRRLAPTLRLVGLEAIFDQRAATTKRERLIVLKWINGKNRPDRPDDGSPAIKPRGFFGRYGTVADESEVQPSTPTPVNS